MPPIRMTRAEYEALYGIKPVISSSSVDTTPAPIRMTRAEYESVYKSKNQEKPPLLSSPLRVLQDIPSDVKEASSGIINAAREGGQRFTEAFTKEGLTIPQRIAGAAVAPASAVANMAGEAVLGTFKILTTDEFEKAVSQKIGEVGTSISESNNPFTGKTLGEDARQFYDSLSEADKYTLSNIIAPTANVFTSVATGGTAPKVGKEIAERTIPIANKLKEVKNTLDVVRDEKAINNVASEIAKIEEKYAPIRKANTYSKDVEGSRNRIAQSNVLENAVDENGLLRTEAAVKAYKSQTIDGVEDVVRKNLEVENKSINLNEIKQQMQLALMSSGLEGGDLATALKGIEKEIKGLSLRADELGNVQLFKIQDAKIGTTNNINFNTPPETATYRKTLAKVYKEIIESKSDLNVKEVNSELAKYYGDIERLQRLDGRRVEGGKLGKYTSSIVGTGIGMGAGSVAGGFGTAVGGIIGGEAAALLKGKSMSKTLRSGGKGLPENQILKQAQERAKQGAIQNLKKSDVKVSAPSNVPKTKEIKEIESQIDRNVKLQKRAIKDGDFTLVAQLKEIYKVLVEKLKAEVRWVLDNMNEAGFIKNPLSKDNQSIPLQRNQRNATTPPKINSISKTVQDTETTVKSDVTDDIIMENLMRLDNMEVDPADTLRLDELKKIADKRALNENEMLEARAIVENSEGSLPKANMSSAPAKTTDLLAEAKSGKYKDVDEFVKAQGTPVYHGTKSNIDIKNITAQPESRGQYLGNGIYFTKFKEGADLYGGKTINAIVNEKDFLNISNLKGVDRTNKIGSFGTYKQYLKNSNLEDTEINFKKWQKNQQEVADKILDMGYKGVTDGQQHVIFDKSALKTKSQLTDIWKKANKAAPEQSLIAEAKKYKSAEEFVKAQGTPVYHGTQAKFDKFETKFATDAEGRKLNLGWGKNNFYFTTKKGEALKYATRERSPEVAKLYPKGEPNVIEAFVDIKNPFDIEIGKNAERWRKVRDGYFSDGVSDFNYHKIPKGKTKAEAFVEQLKKEGYDGIIDGQEITVFSESSIKTKSQLTDIWKKANGKTGSSALLEEAKKFDNGADFYNYSTVQIRDEMQKLGVRGKEQFENWYNANVKTGTKSYAMSHRPTQTGATADNITQEVSDMGFPKDFYDNPQFYAQMSDKASKESLDALMKVRGNPDATVTIYRASPKNEINEGDWVTLSKEYAKRESMAENTPVHSFKVKAKDIQFAGDDINEFGYWPTQTNGKTGSSALLEEAKGKGRSEFVFSPKFEYHLSTSPNLKEGAYFADLPKAKDAGARGGGGESIFTTKNPQAWHSQLAFEQNAETPNHVYLVEVKNPNMQRMQIEGSIPVDLQTVSNPNEVRILKKLGTVPNNKSLEAGLFESEKNKYLEDIWKKANKK